MSTENLTEMKATQAQAGAMEIVVDDGSQRVPIKNMHGEEVGVFYFRPTDMGIVDRYNKMADKFDEITSPLEKIGISADGMAADGASQEEVDALREAERRLFDMCDYMFGGNMSEAFFGKMHPFSPVNGAFYCETAIEAVGRYISAQFETETKKISKRIDKYTHGYKPGQKGGRR